MSQAQLAEAADVSEPMTWEKICDCYPDEWVCRAEIDSVNDTDFEFRTARVIGHGKTRKEPLDQARPFRDRYRSASSNRNAIYLCEQAAEKVIRAVLTSEGQHAGIKHELAES